MAVGIKLPVISTSFVAAVTAEPPPEIDVTLVVVVSSRTSIKSATAGASVNVNVVPLTLYAVVGICTTPLILTIQLLVVWLELNVNTVALPLPVNWSSAITVNVDCPTLAQVVLLNISRLLLVVLKRIIPVTPVLGRTVELPTGIKILVVLLNATRALVVCVALPKLAVPVAWLTKNVALPMLALPPVVNVALAAEPFNVNAPPLLIVTNAVLATPPL